jgi:hypothetical protein
MKLPKTKHDKPSCHPKPTISMMYRKCSQHLCAATSMAPGSPEIYQLSPDYFYPNLENQLSKSCSNDPNRKAQYFTLSNLLDHNQPFGSLLSKIRALPETVADDLIISISNKVPCLAI